MNELAEAIEAILLKRGFYFRPVDGPVFHGDGVVSAGKLAEEIAFEFEPTAFDGYRLVPDAA